jgi:phosphoribosylaminoimidazolecarboxamide formyltransferase / IMP cyclohydrolase
MNDIKKMYKTIMADHFPEQITIQFGDKILLYKKRTWKIPDEKTGELIEKGLRYGENPEQEAALYELVNGNLILGDCQFIEPGNGLVSRITEEDMIQAGKHPGKTNLTDLDNGLNIMKYLMNSPAAAILKHNNPCGVAYGKTIAEAYDKANMADRIAAFGGCLVINRAMDKETAKMISRNYLEVVAAPEFEEGAIEILAGRKNLRIIRVPRIYELDRFLNSRFVDFKSLIDGGIIVQQSPVNRIKSKENFLPAVGKDKNGIIYSIKREPTEEEYIDMLFGWNVEQGITSNSVIYVKDGCTVGIGTGEQDRVGVAEIAVFKARTKYADALCFRQYGKPFETLKAEVKRGSNDVTAINEILKETEKVKGGLIGAIMVSDAFFPFRDGVDVGIKEGITGIVNPGGSQNDYEVIQACNEAKPQVTMVFTGQRAFKH